MKRRLILRKLGGVIKRQEGGAMPEEGMPMEQAPAAEGQQTLEQMVTQYAEGRSPEVAVMIADMILDQYMQSQKGGAAQPAPEEMMPEEAPMARRGMMMNPYR